MLTNEDEQTDDRRVDAADELTMSFVEFMRVWKLTWRQVRQEMVYERLIGRFTLNAIPELHCLDDVEFTPSAIRAWLARRDLPASVRRKVIAAGSFDRLTEFINDCWSRVQLNPFENSVTLPNGRKLVDVWITEAPPPN